MIHWSIRNVQIRSRKLNEQLVQKLQEAHVVFVQMTEIQEKVRRGELAAEKAKASLEQAEAFHAAAMNACSQLLVDRVALFDPFIKVEP
ncbi:hypothetical protein M0R72_01025 [Candidatus Pacearchaeota archaeon]|jgi:hypothetical protein|nr:hypothetical protein [Candidatus Pacearchaeota archaeon]